MKIRNHSRWRTRDLKKLTTAVAKYAGLSLPHRLFVRHGRNLGCDNVSGYATYDHSHVCMTVPFLTHSEYYDIPDRILTRDVVFPVERYAQVLIHELGHNHGLKHREMMRSSMIEIPESILKLSVNASAVKPRRSVDDRKRERHVHALKMLKSWSSRLKRAETLVRKWRKKVRYYEGVVSDGG